MYRQVRIKWIDSCASNQNWLLLDELNGDVEPIFITTLGVLIQENDKAVVVAQNYGHEPAQVCNLMTIPKGCIESMEDLK